MDVRDAVRWPTVAAERSRKRGRPENIALPMLRDGSVVGLSRLILEYRDAAYHLDIDGHKSVVSIADHHHGTLICPKPCCQVCNRPGRWLYIVPALPHLGVRCSKCWPLQRMPQNLDAARRAWLDSLAKEFGFTRKQVIAAIKRVP